MSKTDLALAWEKFRHGDALTDAELNSLIADIEIGIPFLENRGETGGVLYKARLDREALLSFRGFRVKRQNKDDLLENL